MRISSLQHKLQKLPRILIYKKTNVPLEYTFPHKIVMNDLYNMADTKSGKFVGHMYGHVKKNYVNDEIYPLVKQCDTFYIDELQIKDGCKRKGYGSEFIKLAQAESKNQNCNGRVTLVASSFYDVYNPSHIFYRKQGFKTVYEEINKNIDECISSHDYTMHVFQPCYMYLPIGDKPPVTKITKIKNFIKQILHIKKAPQ